MSDPVRVLVTGSRYYPNVSRVREAATDVEAVYAGSPLILVHGRCDPRNRDAFRTQVPWGEAEGRPLDERMDLLGGDWLMAQVAADHGWGTEAHRADWSLGKQAGFQRNATMIGLGAEVAVALTDWCDLPDCTRKRGAHITHGTDHCAGLAELARIKTWRYPA
jgi:hypothetical protein